ncbi:hypothetical protein B0H16DRAFT_1889666 [Mycena metata]|uniref:DUF6535 domain-containing protein n=1 Tax=Mycena metata TaxID=1033252 RepID=A0AAD7N3S0_9AGAR|nr:hypothetical protein B0H16DRAFT_1889666 [Mycena metata]
MGSLEPPGKQGFENEPFIDALKSCFSDLIQKQEEQTSRLVDAFKVEPPVADTNASFWNAYMKVADAHNQQLRAKYSTDLDISLIFAGLFSAISSAFIIQIQPQFPTSNRTIIVAQGLLYTSLFTSLVAALLAGLGKQWIRFYEAVGSSGTIEERGLQRQRKLDGLQKWKFDTVLQTFPLLLQLALFQFSAALPTYLWIVSVPISGLVIALTSAGFLVYISVLGCAIAFTDCPFQTPLSASLAQLLPTKATRESLGHRLRNSLWRMGWYSSHIRRLRDYPDRAWSHFAEFATHLLPYFKHRAPAPRAAELKAEWDYLPDHYFSFFWGTSREAPAIMWILETSTDPEMISNAASMARGVDWPDSADLDSILTTLGQTFISCFKYSSDYVWTIREGMARIAINCGMAYCSLRLVIRAENAEPSSSFFLMERGVLHRTDAREDSAEFLQLVHIFHILQEWPVLPHGSKMSAIHEWGSYIIPSLRPRDHFDSLSATVEYLLDQFSAEKTLQLSSDGFSDYLCGLNGLFTPMSPRILRKRDRGDCRVVLITQLFNTLRTQDLPFTLVERIVSTTFRLGKDLGHPGHPTHLRRAMVEASYFCSTLPRIPRWLDIALSAITLVRVKSPITFRAVQGPHFQHKQTEPYPTDWIYIALEHLSSSLYRDREWDPQITVTVQGLLQALACDDAAEIPTSQGLHIILTTLSGPGPISAAALLVLYAKPSWFLEPTLQSILHAYPVLRSLGRIALTCPPYAQNYIALAASISNLAEWKPCFTDLVTWITVFGGTDWHGDDMWGIEMLESSRENFLLVLRNIWLQDFDDRVGFTDDNEKCSVMAITALTNAWDTFSWSSASQIHEATQIISLQGDTDDSRSTSYRSAPCKIAW